jgi:subfamily B ATP-binding cassette protein MsbA
MRLALYAVGVGMLMIIPVKILSKRVKRHATHSEETISSISNTLNESLNSFELIKVYGREEEMLSRFDSSLDRYEHHQLRLAKYQLLSSPFMEFFIASAISIVIYVGGGFVVDDSMSAGDFFAFMVALMMLYAPIKNLTQNYSTLFTLNSYVERVEQVLAIPQEDNSVGEAIDNIENIGFDEVSYSIEDTTILHNISMDIQKEDSVAIVGRSGSGKSTLISLLTRLAQPTSGDIYINNQPIDSLSVDDIRESISYVNQSAGVFNSSIQDNILYGREMDKKRYNQVLQDAQCSFITLFDGGDSYIVGENGNRLSGGQRQRVAMARAMYRGSSLFILDEATSALDANTEVKIQQALERILSEHTSIIIAHRLSTIQQCNKVIVLEKGRVVASGSYDEISCSDAFKRNFMVE